MMSRMAVGLGMTSEEWKDLRAQVDDSFWVMRVIGIFCIFIQDQVVEFRNDEGILHCRMITMVFPVAHTSGILHLLLPMSRH